MPDSEPAVGVMVDSVEETACGQCDCRIDVSGIDPFAKVECPSCGNTVTVPARLGSFLLLDLLGTGGMGGVYSAQDETLGRYVAVKVMLKSVGEDSALVETFKREAQSAARLNHPNVAQIYSFGQEKGQPYIVMELVSGQHFDKMVGGGKPLDQALVVQVGLDIAEGLMAADEIGLVHGDVKPENILLNEKNRAKLVDFGIATLAGQARGEGIWGTPYYISPEKLKGKPAAAGSDIYSLGATLYHALTGHPPFEGKTPIEVVRARLKNPPKPIHLLRTDIDKDVADTVMRMLQMEPGMRHPTYASLVSDLKKILRKLAPRGTVGPRTKKVVLTKKRMAVTTSATASQGTGPVTIEAPVSKRTKVVVRSRKSRRSAAKTISTTPAAADAAAQSADASADKGKAKGEGAGKKASAPRTGKKKKASKAGAWFLTVFIVVAVVGGLIGMVQAKKAREMEQRTLLAQAALADELYGKVSNGVTNIIETAKDVQACAEQATNALFFVHKERIPVPDVLAGFVKLARHAWDDGAPATGSSGLDINTPDNLYKAYRAAIKAGDIESVLKCVHELPGPDDAPLTAETAPEWITVQKGMTPKSIVKREVGEDSAMLVLLATVVHPLTKQESRVRTTVTFIKVEGMWKIHGEKVEEDKGEADQAAPGASTRPRPERDGDVPVDVMTREEIERQRQRSRPAEPVAPAPAAPEAGAGEPDGAAGESPAGGGDAPPKAEPKIKVLTRKIVQVAAEAGEAVAAARGYLAKAVKLRNEAAVTAPTSAIAFNKNGKLQAVLVAVAALEKKGTGSLADAKATLTRVEEIRGKEADKRDEQRRMEEEAARIRAEEEERQRKEQEHQERMTAELQLAEQATQKGREFLAQHQYKEAADHIKTVLAECTTDEGKAAVGIVLARYERLQGLKEFLVEQLSADPFGWGWRQDGPQRDVFGADATHVEIKGGKKVPWSEVTRAQYMVFVEHYRMSRKVNAKGRADANLAAAILFFENGFPDRAQPYLESAVMLMPTLEEEGRRLVPMN